MPGVFFPDKVRRIKIPDKYLTKLRAKCKGFKLTEFYQYTLPSTLTYTYWLNNDLHTYPYYLWPKFHFGIFGPYVKKYDKIFKSGYSIFDRSLTKKKTWRNKNTSRRKRNRTKKFSQQNRWFIKNTSATKKFFLYDEGNYLTHTLFTELNKEVQIYGLISTDGIKLKSSVLVTPKNSLKFNGLEKKYKEKIVLQLEDIRREGKIDVKDNKLTNIPILSSTKKK